MTAVRETIFAAVDAALTPGVQEYERAPSGDPAKFPARHVHDGGMRIIEREAQNSRYSMDVTVEGFVQLPGGAAAHGELNALYADTVTKMLALIGTANIESIEEGDMRVAVAPLADKRRLAFSQDFTFVFATRRGDPTQI